MKKLAVAAVASLAALASSAAREDLASIRLAPVEKVSEAIIKVADFAGNSIFGPMAAMSLAASDATNACGTGACVLSGDTALSGDLDKLVESLDEKYVKAAGALPDGVIAQLKVFSPAMRIAAQEIAKLADDKDYAAQAEDIKRAAAIIGDAKEICIEARIEASAVVFDMKCAFARGAKTLTLIPAPLADAKPLAFAKGSPLGATATMAKGKFACCPVARVNSVFAFLKSKGINFRGIKAEKTAEGFGRFELDLDAIIGYLVKDAEKEVSKLAGEDEDKFVKELEAAMGKEACGQTCGEDALVRTACYVKGAKGIADAQKTLERLMPEAAKEKCLCVGVAHYYAFGRLVLDALLKNAETASLVAAVKGIVPMLPPFDNAGAAAMAWRDGDAVKARVRISAAEIRGFGTAISSIVAMFAQAAQVEVEETAEDDDD